LNPQQGATGRPVFLRRQLARERGTQSHAEPVLKLRSPRKFFRQISQRPSFPALLLRQPVESAAWPWDFVEEQP
jgi:hypothetical protein